MTIEFGVVPFFLFFVCLSALVVAKAGSGNSDTRRLDPKRIQERLIADKSLSEEELAYLAELAVLELPRRHLIC